MTTTRRELTEAEVATLCNALRVAAENYDQNASNLRKYLPGCESIAVSDVQQADDARALADLLESAGYIEIGPEAE